MISDKLQGVADYQVPFLFLFFAFFATLIGVGTSWLNEDSDRLHKEQLARVVGYQVLQIYKDEKEDLLIPADRVEKALLGKKNRAPASLSPQPIEIVGEKELKKVGFIGKDPWGQPYMYKIIPTYQNKTQVFILSLGENHTLETTDFNTSIQAPAFQGDDYGIMLVH